MPGHIIILSAPSRCGKDTILEALKKDKRLQFVPIITYTTRPKRPQEREGVHHFFVSEKTFRAMIRSEKFLEWARVRGAYFGTPARPVGQALARGNNILLKIEVKGMKQVRRKLPQYLTTIFIKPQSIRDISSRMKLARFSAQQQRIRLSEARREIAMAHQYDIVLTNVPGKLEALVKEVRGLMHQVLRRPTPSVDSSRKK